MRSLLSALLAASAAMAVTQDGAFESSPVWEGPGQSDAITITVVNTWQPTYAPHVLGLEYRGSDNTLIFVSSSNNTIYLANPDTGAQTGSFTRPAGMTGFGVAWNGTEYFINGWNTSSMYHSPNGTTWTAFANPAGTNGRGLSYDGALLWESNSTSCVSLNPDGTGAQTHALSGVPSQISGFTCFPLPTDDPNLPTGLAATCYNTHNFYFFAWNGTTMTPLGSAPCPVSVSSSLGLTYAASRGTFFWSYSSGGGYYVAELDIDLGISLDHETWGQIKATF